MAALANDPWGNGVDGAVVYEFVPATSSLLQDGTWQLKGGEPLSVAPTSDSIVGRGDICLSADGNIIVSGSGGGALVQQYNAAKQSWEPVGTFQSDGETKVVGLKVACSPDARTIVLAEMTTDESTNGEQKEGKVVIWKAVE